MKKMCLQAAMLVLLGLGSVAQAAITIDTVTVGDPGNAADTQVMIDGTTGYGSVSYTYNIGKYEVTAGQYCAFLNAVAKTDTYGLYNTVMADPIVYLGCNIQRHGTSGNYSYSVESDWANRPVNYVSFLDACRFANWLGNGQKTSEQDETTTERGAYNLDGYIFNGINFRTIERNANWTWAVTSEDEWYKAAYYKGGGTNAGYWLYPTQSDTAPGNDMVDPFGNNANYYTGFGSYPIDNGICTTVVGEFQNSGSAYATYDQGGNVWEWNDTIVSQDSLFSSPGLRGGGCLGRGDFLQSTYRLSMHQELEDADLGFRVVQAVPEPSSIIAIFGGLAGLVGLRRRTA